MDKSTYEKRDERLCVQGFDITQTAEAGGELTMPDYYPEIRRVVSVTADALPDSKYLSDGNLEVGGTLAFYLLYIGDDGALSSVPYVTEYTQSMPIGRDFTGGSADIRVESTAESVTCRPLAPRTVSLKAKVKSRVCADKSEECALKCTNEDGGPLSSSTRRTLERLETEIPTVFRRSFSATGNVTGEEKLSGNVKPILCRGEVLIDQAKAGNDSVTVKGSVLVSCLVLTADGIYKTVYSDIPFEERITAERTSPDCICAAYGRAASVTVNAGEDGTLGIDAEYDIDVVTAENERLTVTDDIYSTEFAIEEKRGDMKVLSLICLENGTVTAAGEGRRKSERGEGDHIISQSADAKIERVDIKEGKAHFSGSCNFKVLIASGGDVASEEFSAPVKLECPASVSAQAADTVWHAHIAPSRVECHLEEGKMTGRCELHLFAEAVKVAKCSPITEAVVGMKETTHDEGSVVRICYPEKGKRIWDIAKECRSKVGETERINKVTRHDLSDGSPLIVK